MEVLNLRVSRRQSAVILLLLISLVQFPIASPGQEADEYEVKAAYIYNFGRFVEWPSPAETPSFAICILGDDPFQSGLEKVTSGKLVGGRPLQVRRIKEGMDGRQCQIVFVGASERAKAPKLIESVRGAPVLTVGESMEFLRLGGMIFLSTENNHVSVVINPAATEAVRLKVSAKLMTLAKIYKP